MTYGTHEDMKVVRRYLTDEDLLESLDKAPPGIFDVGVLESKNETLPNPSNAYPPF